MLGANKMLLNASQCKDYLSTKFGDKSNPTFFLKEIHVEELADLRAEARLKKYPTIEGSDSFQIMIFQPHATTFKAAPHLCICDSCLTDYGSLFSLHHIPTTYLLTEQDSSSF